MSKRQSVVNSAVSSFIGDPERVNNASFLYAYAKTSLMKYSEIEECIIIPASTILDIKD